MAKYIYFCPHKILNYILTSHSTFGHFFIYFKIQFHLWNGGNKMQLKQSNATIWVQKMFVSREKQNNCMSNARESERVVKICFRCSIFFFQQFVLFVINEKKKCKVLYNFIIEFILLPIYSLSYLFEPSSLLQ